MTATARHVAELTAAAANAAARGDHHAATVLRAHRDNAAAHLTLPPTLPTNGATP